MVQLHAAERRRFPRVPFSSPIEYQSALGLENTRACDLSGGGMLVAGRTALAIGNDVWLKFKPPATPRPMFLQGRVVRLGPATASPGEHDGFAIGFVDLTGTHVEELDRSVRRSLAESGFEPPAPPAAASPVACHVAFRDEREFVDAYTHHLCGGHIEIHHPEPLAVGSAVELELELPNYYEVLRVAAEIEGESNEKAPHQHVHRARILDPSSEAMRFVHGFASVFLGARETKGKRGKTESVADAPALGKPPPAPAAEVAPAAAAAAPAPAREPAPPPSADLGALVAEALAALDEHAVFEWKSPRALLAPEEAAEAAEPTRETQRIENIAEVVAKTYRGDARPAPAEVPPLARPDGAPNRMVSGKSAAAWATALVDEDPDLRAAAASALGKLGSTAAFAVSALAGALADRDPRVRRAAAWALGDVGADAAEAVPALMDALADLDGRVRWRAIRALRAIGPAAALAVPDLSKALTDEDDRVRQWAATALADLAGIGADSEASIANLSV